MVPGVVGSTPIIHPNQKTRFLKEIGFFGLEVPPTDSRVRQLADEQIPSFRSLSHVGVKDNRNATMDVAYFDKLRAIYFDDYLWVQGNFSSRTINGDISYIKSFFQVLVDREIITINPFQKLKKHKEASSRRNLALSKNQIIEIKKVIEKEDRQLWVFVQFIYYCYLRPNEVRQLTFRYIHLGKRQIFIPGHISKNGMDGYVTIPEVFARELKKSGIFKTDNEYVFQSKNDIKPVSKNVMGYRYRQLVKKLKLSKSYTLFPGNIRELYQPIMPVLI